MAPDMGPYEWFSALIDTGKAAFNLIVKQHGLPRPEIRSWTLGGDTYAPVTSLTWETDDGIKRNLHVAVVAPDDARFLVPGSCAVVDANAWTDLAEKGGTLTRRAITYEIGKLENLTPETLAQHENDLTILLWQAYGAISRVDRAVLQSQRAERDTPGADPGPIRLERWLGE
jgi:hypothetical protein